MFKTSANKNMKIWAESFLIKHCELKIAKIGIKQTQCENYVVKLQFNHIAMCVSIFVIGIALFFHF
jgi:hypothetical protein